MDISLEKDFFNNLSFRWFPQILADQIPQIITDRIPAFGSAKICGLLHLRESAGNLNLSPTKYQTSNPHHIAAAGDGGFIVITHSHTENVEG